MNVTLRQLRALVAVAHTGSFTLAAESLFITQSALSGLIRELEQSLGMRLVDRSTRKVNLSEVGRSIYPLIDKIIHDLDGVLSDVADLKALKKGSIRIAAPQLMASALLPEVIAAYSAEHPEISVKLVDCMVESVTSRVFSGEVDFGVGPERDPNSDIIATRLFELPFMAVFPAGHPLQQLAEIRWTDIVSYPVISLQGQFTERLLADLRRANRELPHSPTSEVAFMSTALAMVSAGLGVTVCIPYAASLVRLYQLEMRPLSDPEVTRRFYVLTRNGHTRSPATQSFIDFLLGYVGERGNWLTPV